MGVEDDNFSRGLAMLSENPPNLVKALSLIRKAKTIFEEKGRTKETQSAMDKIFYIYRALSDQDYNKASDAFRKSDFKNCIRLALDSYRHLILSEPGNLQKSAKRIKSLIEDGIVELLIEIERKAMKNGYSSDLLNEITFTEKTVIDVFYPSLKVQTTIPDDLISRIGDMKKIQHSLINVYEMLGNKAKDKATQYINEGNINKGNEMVNIAKDLYTKGNYPERINDLSQIIMMISEAQGDAEFTLGQSMSEKGRLKKANEHIKKARDYYQKAKNDKKIVLAEKAYLNIATKIGEGIINDALKAIEFNQLERAVGFYNDAYEFFSKINHRKYIGITEKARKDLYKKLGDIESETADTLTVATLKPELISTVQYEGMNSTENLQLPVGINANTEVILQKLHHYHSAQFYYQKCDNMMLVNRISKKIEHFTETVAEVLLNQGKKDLRAHKFESAFLNFKKALLYYESIKSGRKIKAVQEQIKDVYKRLDREKLENLQKILTEKEIMLAEESYDKKKSAMGVSSQQKSSELKDLLPPDDDNQQFRCKSCGKWVNKFYYDSIQEKCLSCRQKIFCNECGNEIQANDLYMPCSKCENKFCLECANRVYDFEQKRCASCREVQKCNLCSVESGLNHALNKCPECQKYYCKTHWDEKQQLCVNCKKTIVCSTCGKDLVEEENFTCSVCNLLFCSEHFDHGRGVCNTHRKEEICAKCAKNLKIQDAAYKCPECGFMYCVDHFSVFHNKCHPCLTAHGDLICAECGKHLFNEAYYTCHDCKNIFCGQHFKLINKRCDACSQIASICHICNKPIESPAQFLKCLNCENYYCTNHFNEQKGLCVSCAEIVSDQKEGTGILNANAISSQTTSENAPVANALSSALQSKIDTNKSELERNTLKPIVDKYNARQILEPEEIDYLLKHGLNLPKDEQKYINIGITGETMTILETNDKHPFAAIIPEIPITEGINYYGDLVKRLVHFIPDVRETIDGMSCIMNMIFFAVNNPKWELLSQLLRQTLLKPAIDVINVLALIYKKESVLVIARAILDSPLEGAFAGVEIKDAVKFIKLDAVDEEEIGVFSDKDYLNRLLNAFYQFHVGNILKASEIIAILEL